MVRKALRVARLIVGLTFVAMVVFAPALVAFADAGAVVAQQTPYEAPDIREIETPGWLRMFEPLARLPLWGQAAVLSAGVAGMFFVVPMVFRWVWSLGPESEEEDEGGDQP